MQLYLLSELQSALLKFWNNINPNLYHTMISLVRVGCIEVMYDLGAKTLY